MTRAPTRLLESAEPGAHAEHGRRLLEQGRMHAPVAYDVAAGAARFQAALSGAGVGAAQPASSAWAKALSTSVKLGKLCVLLSPALIGAVLVFEALRPAAPQGRPLPQAQAEQAPQQASTGVPAPVDRNASPLRPEAIVPAGAGTHFVSPPTAAPAGEGPPSARSPTAARPAKAVDSVNSRTSASGRRVAPARRALVRGAGSPAAVSGGRVASSRADVRGAGSASVASRGAGVAGGVLSRAADGGGVALGRADGSVAAVRGAALPAPKTTDSIGELEGLARARLLARTEPHAAVELLERLARLHPRGYFVEERDALYVIALATDG